MSYQVTLFVLYATLDDNIFHSVYRLNICVFLLVTQNDVRSVFIIHMKLKNPRNSQFEKKKSKMSLEYFDVKYKYPECMLKCPKHLNISPVKKVKVELHNSHLSL